MTRQRQSHFPPRQQSLSDRILSAPKLSSPWDKRQGHWQAWRNCEAIIDEETAKTYRMLRQATDGTKFYDGMNDLKRAVGVSYQTLLDCLDDLHADGFIVLEKRKLTGTILTITLQEPPPLPDDVDATRAARARYQPPQASMHDVERFRKYWCAIYKERRKRDYYFVDGQDSKTVRKLLTSLGLPRLKNLAWYLLRHGVGADVLRYDRVTIGTFALYINEIANEQAKDEQPGARVR